jgi:hypothetical protein
MSLPSHPESQPAKNLRQFLNEKFREIEQRGDNIISLTANLSGIFDRVTSPNEFTGPLVEAWAHIHLAEILENYTSATARGQEFADARAEYQRQPVLLNIKAKDREMNARSRINLSSFQRYKTHYSQPNPSAFYVMIFEYEWRPQGKQLLIIIESSSTHSTY